MLGNGRIAHGAGLDQPLSAAQGPDPANQRAGADRRLRRRANRCSGRNTHKLKSGREMMMLAEQDFYAALEAGRKPKGSGQHPFSIMRSEEHTSELPSLLRITY